MTNIILIVIKCHRVGGGMNEWTMTMDGVDSCSLGVCGEEQLNS